MSSILIVTWDGGGNVPPALGLAAELVRRGHRVLVLGHAQQAAVVTATGADFRAYDRVPNWDPLRRRSSASFARAYLRLFTDRRFGDAVHEAIAAQHPDLVVVDSLLPAALAASVAGSAPTVALVHTVYDFVASDFARGPVGALAALKRFPLTRSLGAADALLIASPPQLAEQPAPAHASFTGPIFATDETPAEADPQGRRILISLSTIDYAGMSAVLQRIVDAVAGLSDDIVVTTGGSIDPAGIRAPSHVLVRRSLPHGELLAQTALVIGHGGHGTAVKALTAGTPLVVRPMSPLGDQPAVAAALVRAGVGVRLGSRDSAERIASTVGAALHDTGLSERARALGRQLRALDGAAAGADLVERVSRGVRSRSGGTL